MDEWYKETTCPHVYPTRPHVYPTQAIIFGVTHSGGGGLLTSVLLLEFVLPLPGLTYEGPLPSSPLLPQAAYVHVRQAQIPVLYKVNEVCESPLPRPPSGFPPLDVHPAFSAPFAYAGGQCRQPCGPCHTCPCILGNFSAGPQQLGHLAASDSNLHPVGTSRTSASPHASREPEQRERGVGRLDSLHGKRDPLFGQNDEKGLETTTYWTTLPV